MAKRRPTRRAAGPAQLPKLGVIFDGWRSGGWRAADAEIVGRGGGNRQRRGRAKTVKARRRGGREVGACRGAPPVVAQSGPWVVVVGAV